MEMLTFPNDIQVVNDPSLLYAYSFEDGQFDSNTSCWKNLVTGEYDACVTDSNSSNGNVLFTSVTGAFGKGIALGSDDVIVIQNTSDLQLKSVTVLLFYRIEKIDFTDVPETSWKATIGKRLSFAWVLMSGNVSGQLGTNAHFGIYIAGQWTHTGEYGGNPPLGANKWHMLAGTYDVATGKISFYKDGVLIATKDVEPGTEPDYTINPIKITQDLIQRDSQTDVIYDEIRIYDRALSANEIAAIWKAYQEGSLSAEEVASYKQSYSMIQKLITIFGTVFLIGMIYIIKRRGIDVEDTRNVTALFVGVLLVLFIVFVANDQYAASVYGLEAIKP